MTLCFLDLPREEMIIFGKGLKKQWLTVHTTTLFNRNGFLKTQHGWQSLGGLEKEDHHQCDDVTAELFRPVRCVDFFHR